MEKIKLLLYCTKSKPYLTKTILKGGKYKLWDRPSQNDINGKIVAECEFEVEEINRLYLDDAHIYLEFARGKDYHTRTMENEELLKESCLTPKEIDYYLKGEIGKAIHIKNLHIFDKPRELSEYYNSKDYYKTWQPIKKAPQNMMYADYINIELNMFRHYILISIKPEWLCKILNGEKTIEVRRKILKEMMQNA